MSEANAGMSNVPGAGGMPAPGGGAPPASVADMMNVPRGSVPPEFGGDWHKAMSAAKQYQQYVARVQQAGYPPEIVGQLLDGFLEPGGGNASGAYPPAAPYGQPPFPQSQPDPRIAQLQEQLSTLTQQLGQIPTQFKGALDEQRKQAQDELKRAQHIDTRRQATEKAIEDFLGQHKLQRMGKDGNPNPFAEMLAKEARDAIISASLAGKPDDLAAEGMGDYLATPSDDHISQGMEKMKWFADYDAKAAARAATAQMDIPGVATGGKSGGGASVPTNLQEGTPEHMDVIMEGILDDR